MIPRGSACLFTAPELRNPWTPAWHHRLELRIPVLNWDPRLATLVLGSATLPLSCVSSAREEEKQMAEKQKAEKQLRGALTSLH